MSNRDVIMFDVDVTTCVALFLTNILHLNLMLKDPSHKIAKKVLFCYSSILFYSENIYREKIRYFFTVEKYQFYSHLICIEFTACNKIKALPEHPFLGMSQWRSS